MAGQKPLISAAGAFMTIIALTGTVHGFYLPGTAPRDYQRGDRIEVDVNTLTPMLNSQLKSLISHDYYDPRLHFCEPVGGASKKAESLGSIIWGDRIFDSAYEVYMLENKTCATLCSSTIPATDAKFINQLIVDDYGLNWMIDGLPSAQMRKDISTDEILYDLGGANLGDAVSKPGQPALNNHYDIYLQYHIRDKNRYRVVGVLVYPRSAAAAPGSNQADCFSTNPVYLSESQSNQVFYTYSISWMESDVPWALRWDMYLHVFDPKIHWFSLINALVVAIFLVIMVGTILLRTVSKDISRYNAIDLSEDVQEDFGWKLVHGEVFRPPQRPILLSAMVGNGAQIASIIAVTLLFAVFGFLSPSNRGSLTTVILICDLLFGGVAGYVSARVYGSLKGEDWKKNLGVTALAFPILIFTVIGTLNLWLIGADSSGAMPFGTILAVLILWFIISVPLCIGGYFYGMRHGPFTHPVRVNSIPRQIPPSPTYLTTWPSVLLGGILPFGAAFVEAFFVASSLFGHRAYYAFGFLFLTYLVVALTTATITILFTYFILCAEEYRWHWRSFMIGGGSSFWLALYGLWYWASRLSFDGVSSVVLYFGYLFLFTTLNFLMTGSIGFIATYFAMRRLYGSIRID